MYALGSGGPDFTVKRWQVFITYEIVNALLVFCNIWERPLPRISQAALYVSLFSFVVITITVLAKSSGHYQTAHFVFVEFSNGTGWLSAGIAFIVGLVNPNWSFSCLDAATHLAEETLSPETDIPKAIIGTVIIGFITSFSYAISMFFCITDLDSIYASTTGVPIMDIFYQALKSKAGALHHTRGRPACVGLSPETMVCGAPIGGPKSTPEPVFQLMLISCHVHGVPLSVVSIWVLPPLTTLWLWAVLFSS